MHKPYELVHSLCSFRDSVRLFAWPGPPSPFQDLDLDDPILEKPELLRFVKKKAQLKVRHVVQGWRDCRVIAASPVVTLR